MRPMLKWEISTILVRLYTRGWLIGCSSSSATSISARTNSTMASLSSRSLQHQLHAEPYLISLSMFISALLILEGLALHVATSGILALLNPALKSLSGQMHLASENFELDPKRGHACAQRRG